MPASIKLRDQRLDQAVAVQDHRQALAVGEIEEPLVGGKDDLAIHAGRHERPMLEPQVVPDPQAVGQALLLDTPFRACRSSPSA